MKNLKYLFVFLAVGLYSCKEDFLNQSAFNGNIQSGTYYNTVSEVEGATIVQYSFLDYNDWWQQQWWRMLSGEAASDNAWLGVPFRAANDVSEYRLNGENDRVEAQWIMSYKSINGFNENIQNIEKSTIDDVIRRRCIAEIKFLRAYEYLDLVRNFGDVPFITKTLSPGDNTYTKTSATEIYRALKQDLAEAIQVLPLKSEYSTTNKFRVSKGAAQALLAKIELYTENWAQAATLADAVINSGEYRLEPFFGDIWSMTNRNGRESIFEIQYQFSVQFPLLGNIFPQVASATSESGWGYFTATSDLENAFKAQGDSTRLNWTIMRHGFPVVGDPAVPVFNGVPSNNKSARYSRKIYVPRTQRSPGGRHSKNQIYLRLADVYLIKAEAAAMQQQSAPALAALKAVRDRVGLATNMNLTGWPLINAIRTERRLELALEGERLYDIRRWKDETGVPVINKILGPTGSFVQYNIVTSTDRFERGNSTEAQNKGFFFVPGKNNLWPIPSKEIIASEGRITQNSGY